MMSMALRAYSGRLRLQRQGLAKHIFTRRCGNSLLPRRAMGSISAFDSIIFRNLFGTDDIRNV